MKILVAEKIAASAVDVLREPGWTILTHDQLEGMLEKELETADALIVRSAVQANAALLASTTSRWKQPHARASPS
jgi:D-3-phosphoglycerate dehydrogenase